MSFDPRRLPNGHIVAPLTAIDGAVVGHAMVEPAPGDEQFDRWDRLLRDREGAAA